jgi:hypothetical protein
VGLGTNRPARLNRDSYSALARPGLEPDQLCDWRNATEPSIAPDDVGVQALRKGDWRTVRSVLCRLVVTEGVVASKREQKTLRAAAKQEKAARRAAEEARRARASSAARRRRAASYRPPRPPRRDIWTDGRSFWIEGDKGTELRLSAAKTRELLAGGGYVLRRIRLRTNLPWNGHGAGQ